MAKKRTVKTTEITNTEETISTQAETFEETTTKNDTVEEVEVQEEHIVEKTEESVETQEESSQDPVATEQPVQEDYHTEETVNFDSEEKVIQEEIKSNKEILNKKQRMFIFNLISNGYTIRDILANIKYKLKLSDEDFKTISKNVRSIRDLLINIGVDV